MAESAAAAHQAPVQALHPHWQVAIEDTSPMNLCVRREAHVFLGGFPDGALFHMDMEDGAYMMALYEAYGGVKWLGSPSTLYVRRAGNGLDRRMQQFTHAPGTVALVEQDAKYGDARMDLIDGALALVRDRLAEYQAVEELVQLDPLTGAGAAMHAERRGAFGHAYGLARPTYSIAPRSLGAQTGGDGEGWEDGAGDAQAQAQGLPPSTVLVPHVCVCVCGLCVCRLRVCRLCVCCLIVRVACVCVACGPQECCTRPRTLGVVSLFETSASACPVSSDTHSFFLCCFCWALCVAQVVAVLFRGCRAQTLRNTLASLLYRLLDVRHLCCSMIRTEVCPHHRVSEVCSPRTLRVLYDMRHLSYFAP